MTGEKSEKTKSYCARCQEEYTRTKLTQSYCSPLCARRTRWEKKNGRPWEVETKCVECGNTFLAEGWAACCSVVCRRARFKRQQAEANRRYQEDPMYKRYQSVYTIFRTKYPEILMSYNKLPNGTISQLVRQILTEKPHYTNHEVAEAVRELIPSAKTSACSVSHHRRSLGMKTKNEGIRTLRHLFGQCFPGLETEGYDAPLQWFYAAVIQGYMDNRGGKMFNTYAFSVKWKEWYHGLPPFEMSVTRKTLSIVTGGQVYTQELSRPYGLPGIWNGK
jgi:hypothetical protein